MPTVLQAKGRVLRIRWNLPVPVAGTMFAVAAVRDRGEAGVRVGVAWPRAVSQLGHAIVCGRGLSLPVLASVVVIRVAAGAIGSVRCRCPGRRFRVAAVAVAASHARVVITGVVRRCVAISHRCPRIG